MSAMWIFGDCLSLSGIANFMRLHTKDLQVGCPLNTLNSLKAHLLTWASRHLV